MVNYYKRCSLNRPDAQYNDVKSPLEVEIGSSALESFADAVDAYYEAQMMLKMPDFWEARFEIRQKRLNKNIKQSKDDTYAK